MENIELLKLSDEIKKVVRRQDELQKSVDLLYQDRQILEDLVSSVQGLKEIILHNQIHQDNARHNLHADIKDTANGVQDVKEVLKDNTFIVKGTNKNFLNSIKKIFTKEVK